MILAAVAALTLASCAKIDTFETKPVVDENVPIAFTNYTPKSLTKADQANYVDGTTLINNATFAVYGWSVANTTYAAGVGDKTFYADASGAPNFMNPAVVTYAGDTNTGEGNTYSPTRYWPSGDVPAGLSFFAYYPENAGTITPTVSKTAGTNPASAVSFATFSFTAEAAAADMVDFLVSDVASNQYYGYTNYSGKAQTVKFSFHHQLTKVAVKFKTDNTDAKTVVTVTSAQFKNIHNTGTLTAKINGTTTTTEWGSVSGTATYEVFVPNSGVLTTTAEPATIDNATNDDVIFLMVPQDMIESNGTDPQYLEITWTVETYEETAHTNLVSSTTNTKKLYLDECVSTDGGTTQADIDWAMNNNIVYTITVGPKPIWFTAEVGAWDDPVTNGYFSAQ